MLYSCLKCCHCYPSRLSGDWMDVCFAAKVCSWTPSLYNFSSSVFSTIATIFESNLSESPTVIAERDTALNAYTSLALIPYFCAMHDVSLPTAREISERGRRCPLAPQQEEFAPRQAFLLLNILVGKAKTKPSYER